MDNVCVPISKKRATRQSRCDVVEHGEAPRIIRPVLAVLISIGTAWALKQHRAIHEPNRQVRVRRAREDEAQGPCAHKIAELELDRLPLSGFYCAWIRREQQMHVDVKLSERLRQSRANVG